MINRNRLTIMLNFNTYRIPVGYNVIEAGLYVGFAVR